MTRISVDELLNESENSDNEVQQKRPVQSVKSPSTLVFVSMFDNCKYSLQWNLNSDTAKKLSLKEFIRYMISKCNRILKYNPKDSKIFYTDEENDDIFVGSDDEYKELIKVTINKNKDGYPMVINCVKRSTGNRKDGKRNDVLGRDCKTSPGKVIKSSPAKLRQKVPTKPISLTIKYSDEVQELSDSMEKTTITEESDVNKKALTKREGSIPPHSPSHDIRKQQASVFDWMTPKKDNQEANPPTWFFNFMENYKEELVAEISAKVVQSLGVVIDNKLSGLEKKNAVNNKQLEKVVVGKAKKSRDTEKVKKEAMRMTMNINDEAESKELKKLRKSLKKKTDKVVKIAMKIEKKQNQEDKHRKPSISSTSGSEVGINFQAKKEKKCKKKKNRKVKEEEVVLEGNVTTGYVVKNDETIYPILARPSYPLSPVRTYPIVPIVENYPLVKTADKKASIIEQIISGKLSEIKETIVRDIASKVAVEKISKDKKIEFPKDQEPEGKLVNAVFVSDAQNVVKVKPESEVNIKLDVTNMGCLEWTDSVTVQQIIASDKLETPDKNKSLSGLNPGEEKNMEFNFKAPKEKGLYESVWNFFDDNERFGPPLIFKIIVVANDESSNKGATEMKDYNAAVEMKSIGVSATSLEMVEINKSSDTKEENITTTDSDDFDLLANEVDSLNIKKGATEEEDEFEVIPIPSCFDLEVPFELIDKDNKDEINDEEDEEEQVEQLSLLDKAAISVDSYNENEKFIEKSLEIGPISLSPSPQISLTDHVEKLVKLGFGNRDQNRQLLELHNNDIEKVLEIVFEDNSSRWAALRH